MAEKIKTMVLLDMMENHDDDDLLLAVACGSSTTISALQAAYCEKRRDRIPRVINFVESVVSDYTKEEFRKRFRMNRTTFNALLEELMVLKAKTLIPMEKQLLIFIRYISSQITIQNIADNFGVSEYTVFDIVKRVSDEICEQLMPKYIT
jgi:predicted DNA-binding protein YlxM (UPF0122 family)